MNTNTYRSGDLLNANPGLSYRKLDNWCRHGCLGELPADRRGRQFNDTDRLIVQVLARTSVAFEHNPPLVMYTAIADAVRSGTTHAIVELAPGIELHIDTTRTND